MRLTTKLLKEIIKEELDNMDEAMLSEDEIDENKEAIAKAAKALGVPKKLDEETIEEEAITSRNPQLEEGMEALDYLANLPPEQLEAIISYVVKMLGGGAAAIGGLVAADSAMDGGEKIDDRDDLYDED